MRVFLIGFMGSGKTIIGSILAEELGYHFLDLDSLISEQEGMSVSEIFDGRGEAYFRKVEKDLLRSTIVLDQTVIATGGGAACFFDNMDFMLREGLTIYLKASPQVLYERLIREKARRPLIAPLAPEALLQVIRNLLETREPFYSRATLVWDTGMDESPGEIAKQIRQALKTAINNRDLKG